MKYYLNLILILTIIIAVSCTRFVEEEEIQQEIKKVVNNYYNTLENKDVENIKTLFADDSTITGFFIEKEQPLRGWENIQQYFEDQFESYDNIKIWRKNETISISRLMDVVWVTSVNHSEISTREQAISVNYNFTAIFEKIGERWQFVHIHQSKFSTTTQPTKSIDVATLPESKSVTNNQQQSKEAVVAPGDSAAVEKQNTATKKDTLKMKTLISPTKKDITII